MLFKPCLQLSKLVKHVFKKEDRVGLSRIKNSVFEKASLQQWTDEIFTINKVFIRDPVTYKLIDSDGRQMTGIIYKEEPQKM